jgi:hypothetical protein
MKKIIFILFALTLPATIFSQDLIITDMGDSINCRINKIDDENIYFSLGYKGRKRNTMMSLELVKKYEYGYFDNKETSFSNITWYSGYKRTRTAFNFGWSYRTAQVENGLETLIERYFRELRTGFHISSDLNYYFTEYFGIGLKYSFFKSSNEMENVRVTFEDGTEKIGKIKDDISIHFIGPSFNIRLLSGNRRNAFYSGFSAGYVRYINDCLIVDKYFLKGKTIGFSGDLGFDLGLSENVSLGLVISYTLGTLKEYEVDDGTYRVIYEMKAEDYDNLSRIDMSAGLRINLFNN